MIDAGTLTGRPLGGLTAARWLLAIGLVTAACSEPEGELSGSSCPPVDPPTYDSFGRSFMTSYCVECHTTAKRGAERLSAPAGIDFDTLALVRMWTSQIDRTTAIGPASTNRRMPPGGHPEPTDAERRRLGEFIACEVAK